MKLQNFPGRTRGCPVPVILLALILGVKSELEQEDLHTSLRSFSLSTAENGLTIDVRGTQNTSLSKSRIYLYSLPVFPASLSIEFNPHAAEIEFDDHTQVLVVHVVKSSNVSIGISRDHFSDTIERSTFSTTQIHINPCSDGLDNDLNGFIDMADPECQSMETAATEQLEWTWSEGTGARGGFLEKLSLTSAAVSLNSRATTKSIVPLIQDDPLDCRWWPHTSSEGCPHWKQSPKNNSGRVIEPWDFLITDAISGRSQFENVSSQRLLSWNATVAEYETRSRSILVQDTYVLRAESMFVSTTVTLLTNTSATVEFVSNYGSFRLNSSAMWHLGNKRAGTLERNWTTVEACVYPFDGRAPMPARACMSAASAMGDATHFSVGVQCLTPIDPDTTEILYAYMDTPKNNKWPTSVSRWTMVLEPHVPVSVGMQLKFSTPPVGDTRADVVEAMERVVAPYVHNFQHVWGSVPQYCPTPSIAWEDAINYGLDRPNGCQCSLTNPDCSCWWHNGTKLYEEFNVDAATRSLPQYGVPYAIAWRPGVQSIHLTSDGSQCEFNPNADVLDPHQDAFWSHAVWSNMSTAAQAAGVQLGYGMRPTSEILTSTNTSATIIPDNTTVDGYRIVPGLCHNFEGWPAGMRGEQLQRHVARVDRLVARGFRAFYWDSYISPGRIAGARRVRQRHGDQLFIVRESSGDIDMLVMSIFPWYNEAAWTPQYASDHSHFARLLVPSGEVFFGELASPPPADDWLSSLSMHKGNSFMWAYMQTVHNASFHCELLRKSYANYVWRMSNYGEAKGCARFDPPTC
eukprot:m.1073746 g.1073746  ORF g.1073746 m.1073746 type:complete len:801 (-) comp24236_c0_seq7:249-2651(-)